MLSALGAPSGQRRFGRHCSAAADGDQVSVRIRSIQLDPAAPSLPSPTRTTRKRSRPTLHEHGSCGSPAFPSSCSTGATASAALNRHKRSPKPSSRCAGRRDRSGATGRACPPAQSDCSAVENNAADGPWMLPEMRGVTRQRLPSGGLIAELPESLIQIAPAGQTRRGPKHHRDLDEASRRRTVDRGGRPRRCRPRGLGRGRRCGSRKKAGPGARPSRRSANAEARRRATPRRASAGDSVEATARPCPRCSHRRRTGPRT